jgi:hypothetical protein
MRSLTPTVVGLVCMLVGAFDGYLAGYLLLRAEFELIGSAIALS